MLHVKHRSGASRTLGVFVDHSVGHRKGAMTATISKVKRCGRLLPPPRDPAHAAVPVRPRRLSYVRPRPVCSAIPLNAFDGPGLWEPRTFHVQHSLRVP